MSGFFNCPWCGYEMNGYGMFEDEGYHHFNCHSCHKPIVAEVIVYFDVEVDKDKSAFMAELELYEKRYRNARATIDTLRARYGKGKTKLTDDQIAEGLEHYRPKAEVGLVVVDELRGDA